MPRKAGKNHLRPSPEPGEIVKRDGADGDDPIALMKATVQPDRSAKAGLAEIEERIPVQAIVLRDRIPAPRGLSHKARQAFIADGAVAAVGHQQTDSGREIPLE